MKRELVKQLIRHYFFLITEGCGNDQCVNNYCASSKNCTVVLSANDAAALAFQLLRRGAGLCDQQPMKKARTTNSSSVSGSTLHEPTASLTSCNHTQFMVLSFDASVETDPCTVFQENPMHTSDLSRSKTYSQIDNITNFCSLADSKSNSSSFKVVSTETMANENNSPSITPLETREQKQKDSYAQVSEEEVNVISLRNTDDRVKSSELNGSTKHPISKDVLDTLDFASLSIPDDLTYDLKDTHNALMDSVNLNLEQIVSFQTDIKYLNQTSAIELINRCTSPDSTNDHNELLCVLYQVFSTPEALGNSFKMRQQDLDKDLLKCYNPNITSSQSMTKEIVHEMEIPKELDDNFIDNKDEVEQDTDERQLDVVGLSRVYDKIGSCKHNGIYINTLALAIDSLCAKIFIEIQFFKSKSYPISDKYLKDVLHSLEIIYELPWLCTLTYVESIIPKLVAATSVLPIFEQAKLAIFWSEISSKITLQHILSSIQQTIMFLLKSTDNPTHQDITYSIKTIKIIYYASIMAGDYDIDLVVDTRDENVFVDFPNNPYPKHKTMITDSLAEILNINILACRAPLIPISSFYNTELCGMIEVNKDYLKWRVNGNEQFSFLSHPFILTPRIKNSGLNIDHRLRKNDIAHLLAVQKLERDEHSNPYLKIKVRREHIVQDALFELEIVIMQNPSDLKKQLLVEFDGEQTVDEGGVTKEFFHLIVEELFNPDYGMFLNANSGSDNLSYWWFNSFSFETAAQFSLIGLIVGLAIYNIVILNINFPIVIYRKLLGKQCTFNDLQDWNQEIYNGLKNLLDYTKDDIEETFMQTYRICYKNAFGELVYHNLVDNGDQISVNHLNKRDFVDKYANFLLNQSIEVQFNAFNRGFQYVMDESPLKYLFWPEELELIVCGSKVFDMTDLEKNTLYKAGYKVNTPVIRYFWNFAHALPRTLQQKLLQFMTGTDRVPVGGLGYLKITIARNGPDSDRLPTVHTCFNVLLLPEYSSQDKLIEQLWKAINYAEGFGII